MRTNKEKTHLQIEEELRTAIDRYYQGAATDTEKRLYRVIFDTMYRGGRLDKFSIDIKHGRDLTKNKSVSYAK